MANRFAPKSKKNKGMQPLSTGYSASNEAKFVIPSVGIEDVDAAVFNLFDKELPLQITIADGTLKKIPVIFAGGEKWAQLKKNKPLRDKVNSLILPLITIGRTGIAQSPTEDMAGRGINQKTGTIKIQRRLASSDREYQKLTNRINLENQSNVVLNSRNDVGPLTLSPIGDLQKSDGDVQEGAYIHGDKRNNIIETILMPSPQFVNMTYEVIVWTQYTHHMNQVIETLFSSFLPQVQGWRLDTPKGYWFVAEMEEGSLSPETNFEDMSQGERLIKQKFNIKVHAYIFASDAPGTPIPVQRHLSSPKISFEVGTVKKRSDFPGDSTTALEPFLGADDPTLPLENERPRREDGRLSGYSTLDYDANVPNSQDPALSKLPRGNSIDRYAKITSLDASGNKSVKHVKIKNINKYTGETTYLSKFDLSNLSGVELEE